MSEQVTSESTYCVLYGFYFITVYLYSEPGVRPLVRPGRMQAASQLVALPKSRLRALTLLAGLAAVLVLPGATPRRLPSRVLSRCLVRVSYPLLPA